MQIDTHIIDIIENYITNDNIIDMVIPAWTWNALSVMLTKNGKLSDVVRVIPRNRSDLLFSFVFRRLRAVILAEFRKIIARAANPHISVAAEMIFR